MKPYAHRNEFDVIVDSNGIAHLEIMVERENWEIWAKISLLSRSCTEVTLYDGDNEVCIKDEVLIHGTTFRTLEDLQDLREAMEEWEPAEPDYEAFIESRNEALAYDGPLA